MFTFDGSERCLQAIFKDICHCNQMDVAVGIHGLNGCASTSTTTANKTDFDDFIAIGVGCTGNL